MNEEKKVPFKWEFGEETISLQLGMYANNQRLYIGMITHTEDGAEAFADMTVNLPGYSLDPGEAFISGDISKDLLRFIKENKLGKVLPYQVQSGYGKYSAVAFDLEKLKAEFPSDWDQRIQRLSEYMASSGKSYKNHLATIRNWARRDKPAAKAVGGEDMTDLDKYF